MKTMYTKFICRRYHENSKLNAEDMIGQIDFGGGFSI
jgi:hypothetical protein